MIPYTGWPRKKPPEKISRKNVRPRKKPLEKWPGPEKNPLSPEKNPLKFSRGFFRGHPEQGAFPDYLTIMLGATPVYSAVSMAVDPEIDLKVYYTLWCAPG